MTDPHPESMTVENTDQLETTLSNLIENGIEPAVYFTVRGGVGLLYPVGEDVTWYTLDRDPYDYEHDVTGIEFDYDSDRPHVRVDIEQVTTPVAFRDDDYPVTLIYQAHDHAWERGRGTHHQAAS